MNTSNTRISTSVSSSPTDLLFRTYVGQSLDQNAIVFFTKQNGKNNCLTLEIRVKDIDNRLVGFIIYLHNDDSDKTPAANGSQFLNILESTQIEESISVRLRIERISHKQYYTLRVRITYPDGSIGETFTQQPIMVFARLAAAKMTKLRNNMVGVLIADAGVNAGVDAGVDVGKKRSRSDVELPDEDKLTSLSLSERIEKRTETLRCLLEKLNEQTKLLQEDVRAHASEMGRIAAYEGLLQFSSSSQLYSDEGSKEDGNEDS